ELELGTPKQEELALSQPPHCLLLLLRLSRPEVLQSVRVPLPSPHASSLADGSDPESDLVRAACPTVPCLLATVVTDPLFESTAASALVAELVDFAAACRLDYAASLVVASESDCPLSLGGECALGTDVLEDRQEDFECFAAAVPHLISMTTLAALGFAPFTVDPSLFLRTDTSLPPFYVLVARRTITLTQSHMVHQVLQRFGFRYSSPQTTPLPTGHSLSTPPLDDSVEPSDPYPELVGCLMYVMTCIRPDLAYPLSILARYVAPGRHRPVHWGVAKSVLRYLCSTSGMGLVLERRGPVVLTGYADAMAVAEPAGL
ncbi:unnamed protein product, partial [Closterium sp. NIES-54]